MGEGDRDARRSVRKSRADAARETGCGADETKKGGAKVARSRGGDALGRSTTPTRKGVAHRDAAVVEERTVHCGGGQPVVENAARSTAVVVVAADDPGGIGARRIGDSRRKPAAKKAAKPAVKRVAWSAKREAVFLATLAETGNVLGAARASGLSSANVYKRRERSAAFRAAWAEALREGYVRLETHLLQRALNGVRKPVWYGGKKVGSVVEHSDRLALALIAQHRASVGASAVPATVSIADVQATLTYRLAEMNRRLGGAG